MVYEEILAANPLIQELSDIFGVPVLTAVIIIVVVSIWSLVWKGFALWKSAKKNHMVWFIVILIVNTIGILEILYIYVFSKMDLKKKPGIKKQEIKKKK